MQLTKLGRAMLAIVTQQSCLFTASGALPPRQLLLGDFLRLLFARQGLNFAFRDGKLLIEVSLTGQFGSFGDVLKVLFFSG